MSQSSEAVTSVREDKGRRHCISEVAQESQSEWFVCRQCQVKVHFPPSMRHTRMVCPTCRKETVPDKVPIFRELQARNQGARGLNVGQKVCLAIGTIVLTAMLTIPPGCDESVFKPGGAIDFNRLGLQAMCVAVATASALVLSGKTRNG
jgi:hypothetical protein